MAETREKKDDKRTKRSFPSTSELDRIRFITLQGQVLSIGGGAWRPEPDEEKPEDEKPATEK